MLAISPIAVAARPNETHYLGCNHLLSGVTFVSFGFSGLCRKRGKKFVPPLVTVTIAVLRLLAVCCRGLERLFQSAVSSAQISVAYAMTIQGTVQNSIPVSVPLHGIVRIMLKNVG